MFTVLTNVTGDSPVKESVEVKTSNTKETSKVISAKQFYEEYKGVISSELGLQWRYGYVPRINISITGESRTLPPLLRIEEDIVIHVESNNEKIEQNVDKQTSVGNSQQDVTVSKGTESKPEQSSNQIRKFDTIEIVRKL